MTKKFKVRIAFLDVGQGDTIVISIPEEQEAVVVDCANADVVLKYLKQQEIEHLRGLVVTHLHLDHYKGAVEFLNNCEREIGVRCERVVFNWPRISASRLDQALCDPDGHSDSSDNPKINQNQRKTSYFDLRVWVQQNKGKFGPLSVAYDDDRLHINGSISSVVRLLHPHYAFMEDLVLLNDASGVLKVQGVDSSAILMGDLENTGWKYLLEESVDVRSDVLKFPHHGAWKDADPNDLIDAISPSVIIISVGTKGAKYNHPNPHVFAAIAKRRNIHLICTQVTEQCALNIPQKSKIVKQQFEQLSAANQNIFFTDQSGCPCAGTVIIELGESVFILQPHLKFHRETVINPYYKSHKCSI